MKNLNRYPVLNLDYILRQYKLDKNSIQRYALFGLQSNKTHELNKDAAFVVNLFTGDLSVASILEEILSKYDKVTRDEAFALLSNILESLEEKSIIYYNQHKKHVRSFPPILQVRGVLDSVYIRLTNACDLKCLHCSVDAKTNSTQRMDDHTVKRLLDQISDMMCPSVTFTGGEPTLVDSLPDIIRYANQKPLRCILMTNGYGLTDKMAELFVKNGISQVNVSLDGAEANTHDKFRGVPGAFAKAINAVKVFKKLGLYVETTTVVHDKISGELERILEIGTNYELDNMKFLPVMPFKRGKNCNYSCSMAVYKDNLSEFIHTYGGITLMEKENEKLLADNLRCSAGVSVLAVNHNGDVLPCNNFDTIPLGNINKRSLYDIYCNPENANPLTDAIKIKGSECEHCDLLSDCHGGCAMVAYSYHNNYNLCDEIRKMHVIEALKYREEN